MDVLMRTFEKDPAFLAQVVVAIVVGLLIIVLALRPRKKKEPSVEAEVPVNQPIPGAKGGDVKSNPTFGRSKFYSTRSYFVICEEGAAMYCGTADELLQGEAKEMGRLQCTAELYRVDDVDYKDKNEIANGLFKVEFAPLNNDAVGEAVFIELSSVGKASGLVSPDCLMVGQMDDFFQQFRDIDITDEELTTFYEDVKAEMKPNPDADAQVPVFIAKNEDYDSVNIRDPVTKKRIGSVPNGTVLVEITPAVEGYMIAKSEDCLLEGQVSMANVKKENTADRNKWNKFQGSLSKYGIYEKYKKAGIEMKPEEKWSNVKDIFNED